MRLREIETRIERLEHQNPNLKPGPHRYTDDELDGLIAVLRQAEAGEPVDPERDAWAAALLAREGFVLGEAWQ
ncbi:hypothetical protein [Methylobacterium sp. J-070]|uniref:hypothetical protein n=1 Tax=Methylobacterium sp. J-070 TaxID=2836650 RepID=UPI001FB8DDA8|nr:hypothetical protein [Methylobacterium sp. J-070]MCJ2054033.1 hypothetical protein [Methylobacterium sp. J-070]